MENQALSSQNQPNTVSTHVSKSECTHKSTVNRAGKDAISPKLMEVRATPLRNFMRLAVLLLFLALFRLDILISNFYQKRLARSLNEKPSLVSRSQDG